MFTTNTIASGGCSYGTSSISSNGTINLNNIYSSTLSIVGSIGSPSYKQTFFVKGQEIEVENVYNTEYYGVIFSMISLFGYQGYETIKLNGFKFDKKVEDRLKTIFRDEKINQIIDSSFTENQ